MQQAQLNPAEITDIIRGRIETLDVSAQPANEGTIVSVADGIVRVHGLAEAQYGEMIEFGGTGGTLTGMALNLERDSVGCVVLGDYEGLSEGMTARCTKRILEVPVGRELLGRVVDALGNPIDGKGPLNTAETSPVEKVAPGVIARQTVDQPVQMGIKCIDAMVPIGRGQRELIIGDRQIGKTAIAVDAIINQKGTGIKCVYVAIGQKMSTIAVRAAAAIHALVVTTVSVRSRSSGSESRFSDAARNRLFWRMTALPHACNGAGEAAAGRLWHKGSVWLPVCETGTFVRDIWGAGPFDCGDDRVGGRDRARRPRHRRGAAWRHRLRAGGAGCALSRSRL